ncbi:MAG TPA: hypothetical protein VK066_18810 [Chloroflexota bacterium]|nr:hypothetical protein [Chloroflexota bacterium]
MYSRPALALVCALGMMVVSALGNRGGAAAGPDAAFAQFLPTPTRFVPRPLPTLSLPTPLPTPGLPGALPSPLSPTPFLLTASPTAALPTPAAGAAAPAATATATGASPAPADQTAPSSPAGPSPTNVPPAPETSGPPPAPPPVPPAQVPAAPSEAGPQPPTIQLRFGTATYDGVRGSYCWTPTAAPGEAPAPGVCADVAPPAFDTVLAWPAGEPIEFDIDGPEPSGLTLRVYSKPTEPLVLETELPPGAAVTWQPTVAPGAYVLAVTAHWPQGDVTYYFPVGILAAGAPSDAAPEEPSFAPGDGLVGGPAARAPTPSGAASVSAASPAAATASTVLPRSTLGPAATPTAGPGTPPPPAASNGESATTGRVLLRDDFTDPASGWPLESGDPTRRRLGYRDGEYLVARLAGSGGAAYVAYPEPFGDFQAEIDARLVAPTDDAYAFLDFRRQEDGDYYSFLVDPNAGRFLLLRHTNGDDARLIDWTPAAAIQHGTATNRLGVRARGSAITLLLDGTEVGRARDDALRQGWIGFGVGSLIDARAEARFSHLLVTAVE